MKAIMFKAKRITDGEFIEGYYMSSLQDGERKHYIICPADDNVEIHGDIYRIDRETLGQYVGIMDVHGKKVYEGDIILLYYKTLQGEELKGTVKYLVKYDENDRRFGLVFYDNPNDNDLKYLEESMDFNCEIVRSRFDGRKNVC